jgi:hypothetical protein
LINLEQSNRTKPGYGALINLDKKRKKKKEKRKKKIENRHELKIWCLDF